LVFRVYGQENSISAVKNKSCR